MGESKEVGEEVGGEGREVGSGFVVRGEPDRDAITNAMRIRLKARLMMDESERLKKIADTILAVELLKVRDYQYSIEGVGTAVIVTKLQSSFSQKKLLEFMAERYGPDEAIRARDSGVTTFPVQYVLFTPEKEEKGEGGGGNGKA